MREPRSIAPARRAAFEVELADRGHQQHITQTAAARPGQMRVAESANGAVSMAMPTGRPSQPWIGVSGLSCTMPKGTIAPG